MSLNFKGKIAVVTGAGAGLGREYARLLAARGAQVVVNDISSAAADSVVQEIRNSGGRAVPDYNSVLNGERIIQTANDQYGKVDILINNAGVLSDTVFSKMTDEKWTKVLDVHLNGVLSVTQAVYPQMREAKYGRILLITSTSGLYGNFGQTNYAAAKAAMIGFGKTLAKESQKYNIMVNMLAPGAGSNMTKDILPKKIVEEWKAEYVAPVAVFLCSERVNFGGKIFESGGGWAGQVRWNRSHGHYFDIGKAITVEDVEAHWEEITCLNAKDPELDTEVSPMLRQIMSSQRSKI